MARKRNGNHCATTCRTTSGLIVDVDDDDDDVVVEVVVDDDLLLLLLSAIDCASNVSSSKRRTDTHAFSITSSMQFGKNENLILLRRFDDREHNCFRAITVHQ